MAACGTIDIMFQRTFLRNSSSLSAMISVPFTEHLARIGLHVSGQQAQDGFGQRALAAARFAQHHHGLVVAQGRKSTPSTACTIPLVVRKCSTRFSMLNSMVSFRHELLPSQAGVEDTVQGITHHGKSQAGEHQQHGRFQHPVVPALEQGAVGAGFVDDLAPGGQGRVAQTKHRQGGFQEHISWESER